VLIALPGALGCIDRSGGIKYSFLTRFLSLSFPLRQEFLFKVNDPPDLSLQARLLITPYLSRMEAYPSQNCLVKIVMGFGTNYFLTVFISGFSVLMIDHCAFKQRVVLYQENRSMHITMINGRSFNKYSWIMLFPSRHHGIVCQRHLLHVVTLEKQSKPDLYFFISRCFGLASSF
jgi:hypothetical protein